MKNLICLLLLFWFSKVNGQMSVRPNGLGVEMGNLAINLSKEGDRRLAYFHYHEKATWKSFEGFAGVGVHIGTRYITNYKGDGTSMTAGPSVILGGRYWLGNVGFGMTFFPRVDFPFLGGCEMHKHCEQADCNGYLTLSFKL